MRGSANKRYTTFLVDLTQLLDFFGGYTYAKDLKGVYIFHNTAYYERLVDDGILQKEGDTVLGKTDLQLFPKSEAMIIRKNDRKVLKELREIEFFEDMKLPSGLKQKFVSRKSPIFDEDGELLGLIGHSTEYTNIDVNEETATLTLREMQTLAYLYYGFTAKETAKKLAISHRTIEVYVKNIKQKLQCRNRSQLLAVIEHNNMQHIMKTFLQQQK